MKGEQLNKPKLISKYATQKCIPVFVKNSHLDLVHTKDTPNATITFIKYKNIIYCCTCKHVIEVATKPNEDLKKIGSLQIKTSRLIENFDQHFINKDNPMDYYFYPCFKYVEDTDIAIRSIPKNHYEIIAKQKNTNYIDLDKYEEPAWNEIKMVYALGWATHHKSQQRNIVMTPLIEAYVELQSQQIENKEQFILYSELPAPHNYYFSGMSGGIVVYHNEKINKLYPIGIIYEGSNSSPNTSKTEQEPPIIDRKSLFWYCYKLTPKIFEYWLENSKWNWETDVRLNGYILKK